MRRTRRYKVMNIAMLIAFVNAVHNAEPSKLCTEVKQAASRRIKRLHL